MDQSVSRLFYLFKKYTQQNCTPAERNEFIEMVKRDENALELNHLISTAVSVGETGFEINRERADEIFSNVLNATFLK